MPLGAAEEALKKNVTLAKIAKKEAGYADVLQIPPAQAKEMTKDKFRELAVDEILSNVREIAIEIEKHGYPVRHLGSKARLGNVVDADAQPARRWGTRPTTTYAMWRIGRFGYNEDIAWIVPGLESGSQLVTSNYGDGDEAEIVTRDALQEYSTGQLRSLLRKIDKTFPAPDPTA